MRRVLLLALLVVGFMLAGCKLISYRWINTEKGFPAACLQTYQGKHMDVDYCLVPGSYGYYYVEGIARSKGIHSMGRISSGGYYLQLLDGDEIVFQHRLERRGDYLDKPVYLSGSFFFAGKYDSAQFTWDIRYYQ